MPAGRCVDGDATTRADVDTDGDAITPGASSDLEDLLPSPPTFNAHLDTTATGPADHTHHQRPCG
jgi:hypothetical protein